MKVLIVFNHPAPYKVNIFNELAKYVDLTVLFEREKAKDRPDEFYKDNQYHFHTLFLKDGYVGKEGSLSSNVKKYIKHHHKEFDQIVMNGYSHLAEIKAIRYMASHNINFSLMINGGTIHNNESSLKKKLKASIVSKATYYFSTSEKSDEYLIYYGASKEKIYRYPYSNFFLNELSPLEINKNDIREKYHLPTSKRIFISASQFIERKNNFNLIKIFENLDDVLLLVGDGIEKEKYKDYISKSNIQNVIILPYRNKSNLFSIMRSCDAFITLAKEDIFGHTTLEAFANGLPVISSKFVNSSLEFIQEGENGYLVDMENEQEIVDAIKKAPLLDRKKCLEVARKNTFESSAKAIFEILERENKSE